MKRHVVVVAIVCVLCQGLAACVPGVGLPFPGRKKAPKPASEIVDPQAIVARDGAGAIVVTRDASLQRMRCVYDVALDERLVASLRVGEQVTLYADPGERSLIVSIRPENRCDAALAELPLKVVAHATTRVRIVADASFDLRIEATTR